MTTTIRSFVSAELTVLDQPSPPWILVYQTARSRAYELGWRLDGDGTSARMLRGWTMRTLAKMFDEFGAAMQFPDYFGENWPAFDECLSDLSWMPAKRYVLIIAGAEEVLSDEPVVEIEALRDVLVRAGEAWAQPVSAGEAWDRPAVPFHVILQGHVELLELWGGVTAEFRE